MSEKYPYKQNKEMFDVIFSRVNWLEQEIQKLETRLIVAEMEVGLLRGSFQTMRNQDES